MSCWDKWSETSVHHVCYMVNEMSYRSLENNSNCSNVLFSHIFLQWWLFVKSSVFVCVCVFSWTRVFLRRSAWFLGTRKASWLLRTRTWSAASTVPSRSCRLLRPALCSALYGPRAGLSGPGAHNCTTAEDQAHTHTHNISTQQRAARQGFVNLSHIHWSLSTRKAFLKWIFVFVLFSQTLQLEMKTEKKDWKKLW